MRVSQDVRFQQLTEAINAMTKATGYPPTVRELVAWLELSSVSYVSRLLHEMRKLGVIDFNDHQARTLRVIQNGENIRQ